MGHMAQWRECQNLICLCELMAVEDDKRSGLLTALQIVTRLVKVHSGDHMCRVMTHYLLQSTYSELDVNNFLITTVNNLFVHPVYFFLLNSKQN